ncbi:hypothetical protein Fmac_024962 [Flemingia macrophylla]|uniref:DUF4219 domain-containing protein n=1 Tax=Flemingia macrophylla TaxID=520843 RepID=A0ABD1LQW1_9FABA
MAGNNLPYGEGVSIHRPSIFNGENYAYWKIRMKIFIEAIDIGIWEAVENGPFVPTVLLKDSNDIFEKPLKDWTKDDGRQVHYDKKAKNIITFTLFIDEFFRLTHEGTNDVKRSRKHTLTREHKMLKMNSGESVCDFQKPFTHLINHLTDLDMTFEKEELNLKVLQCLDRTWQQ